MKTCKKGLHSYPEDLKRCPHCVNDWARQNYAKNPERILQTNKKSRAKHHEARKAQQRSYYASCDKEARRAYNREQYLKNKERRNEQSRKWRENNKERNKELYDVWYAKNGEKHKERQRIYGKNNRAKTNALSKKHKLARIRATPPWLTELHFDQMEIFYDAAAKLTKEFGVKMQVDHLVPIHGKIVCGLHVPWNLQVLTAEENMKKHNKLEQK